MKSLPEHGKLLYINNKIICAALFLGVYVSAASSAPYVPADDAAVLERLPMRRADPAAAELRKLQAAAAAHPDDAAAAAALARRYFELAMAQGDPRYVGYAEGALRPWRAGDAPAEALFVRGLLKQYRHDFPGALRDFEGALRRDPKLVGAHSWRAAIFMVGADYRAARQECRALEPIASELIATGCRAAVDGTTGRAQAAYDDLTAALQRRADAAPEIRLWVLTRLAELAWRLEQPQAAERHFRAALALGLRDDFLLAAYADFLLEQGRPKAVVELLAQWGRSDNVLLRLALAARRLGLAEAQRHEQALGERFAAAALRGERLHLAEEARFRLELKGDAKGALAAAAENWKLQREPRDAAVLLAAALAAGDPQAAAPGLRWLAETGFEGAQLRRLAAQLK
jgi:Tfp pilus assembly protein PilF